MAKRKKKLEDESQPKRKDLDLRTSDKAEADEAKPVVETPQPAPEAKEPKSTKGKAVAVYNGSRLVRVYSEDQHGKDFKDLAKQFVSHPDRKAFTLDLAYEAPLAPKPEPKDTEVVKVLTPSKDVYRVFSRRQHGGDYKKLAEQFVKNYPKRGYTLA